MVVTDAEELTRATVTDVTSSCNVSYIVEVRTPPQPLVRRMATASLSPAQRRVADLLTHDPQALAFGTVASVAERAGTSAPTVVRLANALGFDGFAELRDAARVELTERIRTDALRVTAPPPSEPLDALITVEQANVAETISQVDERALTAVVDLLSERSRRIFVLPSTQTDGVARRFVDQLDIVRGRALLLSGTEFRVASTLRALRPGDVILSMDIPRHEAALVRTQAQAVDAGGVPVVLSGDVPVSLHTVDGHLLTFARESVGPFDSLVGLTVLCTLLVNAVVERRREDAGRRVLELERTWIDGGLFQI